MTDQTPSTLIRIDDTDLTLDEPADDVRGRTVLDRNGDELGEVDGLVIDEQERQVRFLEVGAGGFLGLGEKKLLVPVDAITAIDDDAVHIATDLTHAVGAPAYDPKLVPDRRYYEDLYNYYAYPPFWAPGYTHPRFRR
ncbi:MAG TPA: PRC-barrel domain-containing protein [Mycobacterium sp.]|nr:PRC-barrel domain-containing protein [Mycobacterium sp.]